MSVQSAKYTPSESIEQAMGVAQKAFALMKEHNVPPVPECYAVWYHYVLGKNKELVQEISAIFKNNVPLTLHTNQNLYNKYIITDRNKQVVGDAASSANRLLGDVLKAVKDFGGRTEEYNQDLTQYMEKIPLEVVEDPALKAVLVELAASSDAMREKGESLSQQLKESQAEIDSLRKNLEQVTSESQKDFLTGLFNRKAFDLSLAEQITLVKEQRQDLCLLMLDIDHFKQFNDKFGHLLGDEVLKIVARAMVESVRGKDIAARFGGEEFALILPATPLAGGMKVAETIRTTIAKRELKRRDTGENYGVITVSIGVALLRPLSDTPDSIIKRADDALYRSKHRGRNRVTAEDDGY